MGRPIKNGGINMTFNKNPMIKKPVTKLLPLNLQFFAEEKVTLDKLQKDFSDSWKTLKGLLDTQADQIRTYGETNQTTADSIKTIEEKLENYETELKGFTDKYKDIETKFNRPDFGGNNPEYKTAGELLIESDSYKNMGSTMNAHQELKSFFKLQTKDLDSADANGGLLTGTTRMGGIFADPNTPTTMRQLLNAQPTTSNSIEYIVETGFTNASAIAPEKSLKPQSDLTFDIETASVKTIAHWIPATRQIIQDAPQLRSYVDNRLTYGLQLTEESQILYGSGVGDNIQGIMTNPNIQDMGARATDNTMIDFIRTSITRSILAGYPATGIVLHPTDWETIELSKGADGHYIWISVTDRGAQRLWRVPVVESTALVEGEFLTGAFGLGAQIWDREQANVRVSEHHADYFAKNMLAILAEERLCLTTFRPESFVKGTFTPVA
jgi:HK97 family phage major capsid protein